MNEMVKMFRATMEVCMNEPEELAKLLREEPDDKIVGEFIGTSVIFASFGFAQFMTECDKADGRESAPELTEFLKATKELRKDWTQMEREYIEMICDFGAMILEYKEETGD